MTFSTAIAAEYGPITRAVSTADVFKDDLWEAVNHDDLPSHIIDGRELGFGQHSVRDTGQFYDTYEGVYDDDRNTWAGALYGA